MKTRILSLLIAFIGISFGLEAQNTFPANGNVGIGTLSPTEKLTVNGTSAKIGGNFKSSNLRIEATDEAGAPAKSVGIELHGYEGRGKGIYIYDKNTRL